MGFNRDNIRRIMIILIAIDLQNVTLHRCACGFVTVTELKFCLLSCIGRRGVILQNHDSPEKGFSAPEMKCSLVTRINSFLASKAHKLA